MSNEPRTGDDLPGNQVLPIRARLKQWHSRIAKKRFLAYQRAALACDNRGKFERNIGDFGTRMGTTVRPRITIIKDPRV